MYDHFEFMGWGGLMGIFWILLLVLLIWLVVGVIRPRGSGGGDDAPSAREILDRRYARGEISREQYEQQLEDLRR